MIKEMEWCIYGKRVKELNTYCLDSNNKQSQGSTKSTFERYNFPQVRGLYKCKIIAMVLRHHEKVSKVGGIVLAYGQWLRSLPGNSCTDNNCFSCLVAVGDRWTDPLLNLMVEKLKQLGVVTGNN